jgi:hypothetical protein
LLTDLTGWGGTFQEQRAEKPASPINKMMMTISGLKRTFFQISQGWKIKTGPKQPVPFWIGLKTEREY